MSTTKSIELNKQIQQTESEQLKTLKAIIIELGKPKRKQ